MSNLTYTLRKAMGLGILLAFPAFSSSFAQQTINQPKKVGTVPEFTAHLRSDLSHMEQEVKKIPTTAADVEVVFDVNSAEKVIGKIQGKESSIVSFTFSDEMLTGHVILPKEKRAYKYFSDKHNIFVEEADINTIICIEMPKAPVFPLEETIGSISYAVPQLESLPGERAVLYIDFDGHNCSGGQWGSINAAPSGMTEAAMTNAWRVASEDFRPYKINVTTIESVYLKAAKNRRMRMVCTPTDKAASGAGGVAMVGSFPKGDPDNTPAWVFNVKGDGKTTGETISHEMGHTLGLNHDGSGSTAYYPGHGSRWAPIMGSSYGATIMGQWSVGEYSGANNKEDDVSKIGNTTNGFGFRDDEAGNTTTAARQLEVQTDGSVDEKGNYGIILKRGDIDVYSFKAGNGNVNLTVKPSPYHPNLDVLIKLTDASGKVIAQEDPAGAVAASLSATVKADTYYLHIDGTGYLSASNTGYSDYASIGEYFISGKIPTLSTGIDENKETIAAFKVYPNPSNNQVNISLNENMMGLHTIQISNILGQVIFNQATTGNLLNIDMSDYDKGVYFVSVTGNNGVVTEKLIKE